MQPNNGEDTPNKKSKIVTLGCRTNQYEGQAFKDQLEGLGYRSAAEGEQADVCIVNTCTVTEGADSSSRHQIRQTIQHNPLAQVIVTGCLAERDPQSVLAIEGVGRVVPNANKEQIVADMFPQEEVPEFSIKHFDAHTRAFVKVQDGCNSFCTYCIIPYVRGRSRSRPIADAVKGVEGLIQSGFKEVVLTGINIGDFDGAVSDAQTGHRLADLIRTVDRIPGLQRLRVSSIDPDEVDEELMDVIINGKTTCPSMHIVLQAGSNLVLKRMNRKYTRQLFLQTIERLRRAHPDFTFTTDIIVGFPGETDQDFEETLEVMREVQFAKVHMFPYSDRPRTRAFSYPHKIPHDLIKKRKAQVLKVAEDIAYQLRNQYVGRTMSILTESSDQQHPHQLFGHTANFLGVWIDQDGFKTNDLVDVYLEKNTPDGLIGKVVSSSQIQKAG